jgi:hypothetical protein
MPTVQFLGRVHPAVMNVTIRPGGTAGWNVEELGLAMAIEFEITNSAVHVNCHLNKYDASDFVAIWMRAFDTVRAAVNLLGFVLATGLTVTLDTFIDPEQHHKALLAEDQRLAGICTVLNRSELASDAFSKILKIVLSEPPLFLALNDLVAGITQPHQAAVVSARALESLRHLIAPGSSVSDGWTALREALKIDRPYLQYITDLSTGPRHGDHKHIPGEPTTEVIRRAWIIMNRFLEYRKGGNVSLPASEFPILTS